MYTLYNGLAADMKSVGYRKLFLQSINTLNESFTNNNKLLRNNTLYYTLYIVLLEVEFHYLVSLNLKQLLLISLLNVEMLLVQLFKFLTVIIKY